MTSYWAIGQRVRSEAEPALGLGIVESFPTPRSLQIAFPAADERRTYNPASAPIRRFELGVGQQARLRDGRTFRVERVVAHDDGLLTYIGQGLEVPERDLADTSASHDPLERLEAGEFSHFEAFDLRQTGWRLRSEVLQQRSRGMVGARVALLPHQLAIAYKVANREYPRALLADEVGLGKTIEACLTFSALRSLGRADRVLVLTPSSLVHQWLVELYRRFNDLFTVAHDDPAMQGGASGAENPFTEGSHLIAPVDWLLEKGRLEQALEYPWDLVIVDEAHHLAWSPEEASPSYRAVEALSRRSQGLLLLTATPLRQGLETEFGLLRLVDPERFADFGRFQEEHAHLKTVADLARRIDQGERVQDELVRLFPEERWEGPSAEILQRLIDRHGTGRVLFRNRRDKLGGFPGRRLHLTSLPLPEAWTRVQAWPEIEALERMLGLPATRGHQPTLETDPRWDWVLETIRSLGDQKVLVMAASVETVKRLEARLRRQSGFQVAVFHEGLGLIERDRQAAYFMDPDGARVLVSSEIGGEGRNFQFCHHLILFDLPVHPDALEQRIGRLDRIGQTGTIHVHAAVVEATPGEALFRWHQQLEVFESPLTGGEHMLAAQAPRLIEVLRAHTPGHPDAARLDAFLRETRERLRQHQAEVQAGVDYLIDLNSFDQELGRSLVQEVEAFDYPLLQEALDGLLEHFGVDAEDLADPRLHRIRPGDAMKVEPFPGLRSGGILATFDRSLALAREDIQFLGPDHPLVEGALGMLLDRSEGRASIARWPGAPEQGVWVEFLFLLSAVGPAGLALERYLPPVALGVTVDLQGRRQAGAKAAGARLQPMSPPLWTRMAGVMHDRLPDLLETAEQAANEQLLARVEGAVGEARTVLQGEQRRLEALLALGNVPRIEVASHAHKVQETLRHLSEARVGLDAVRVILLDPRP